MASNAPATFDGVETMDSGAIDTTPPSARHKCSRSRRSVVVFTALLGLLGVGVAVILSVAGNSGSASFKTPDAFSASFVARSRTNASMYVTGELHKTLDASGDWVLSGTATVVTHGTQKTTVTLVNGAAYAEVRRTTDNELVSQSCMERASVPVLGEVGPALDSSAEVPRIELRTNVGGCDGQDVFAFMYQGLSYLVCWDAGASTAQLLGEEYTTTLANVDVAPGPSPYTVPMNVSSGQPMQCEPVATAESRRLGVVGGGVGGGVGGCNSFPPCDEPAVMRRLSETAEVHPSLRSHARRLPLTTSGSSPWYGTTGGSGSGSGSGGGSGPLSVHDEIVTQEQSTVACVFIHGAGQQPSTFDPQSYWGVSGTQFDACHSTIYLSTDTYKYAFDSYSVKNAVCSTVMSAFSNSHIKSAAVYTHGSGSLMLAAAAQHCSLPMESLFWIELQPSYQLGRIAEFGAYFCYQVSSASRGWKAELQHDFGLCEASHLSVGWESVTYQSLSITTQLRNFIHSNVDAAMCGGDYEGLLGSSYAHVVSEPWAPAAVAASAVKWSTCWGANKPWQPVADYLWYDADVNFVDVTCRNGDGTFGNSRQPCSFMANAAYAHLQGESGSS